MSVDEGHEFDEEYRARDLKGEEGAGEVQRQAIRRGHWDRQSAEKLWLVSYSDFMTIMMIFFLAMFGYSHMMAEKKNLKRVPLAYPEFAKIVAEMQKQLGDQVKLVQDVNKVTLELGENILFESGRADLGDTAKKTLTDLASAIGRLEGDVIVEGHTDDVPIVSRKFRSNWELSAARAFSVVDQLSRAGIPASRLAAWGFGENRPLAPNDSLESRRRNRRIDIVVLKRQPAGKT